MERLTRKSLEYKDTWIADGSLSNIEGVVRGKAIDKLAEFEDFMEKYNIKSTEDLQLRLEDVEHYAYNCNYEQIDEIIKLKQENQKLKYRWQKLKEWIKEQSNPIGNLVISDDETKYLYMSDILDEMQELEKEK